MQVIGWGGGKRGQVFGAQWLLGVWQSRERRRAQWVCWNCCIRKLPLGEAESSLTRTGPFVNPHCYQTSYLSKSHPVRDFWACSDTLKRSAATAPQAVLTTSEVVLRWLPPLSADDKLLSEHKRKYIDPFYLPFVVSVIWAIHKSLRHCLSLWKLSAQIVSICIHKQAVTQEKWSVLKFSLSPGRCFVKKKIYWFCQQANIKWAFSTFTMGNRSQQDLNGAKGFKTSLLAAPSQPTVIYSLQEVKNHPPISSVSCKHGTN